MPGISVRPFILRFHININHASTHLAGRHLLFDFLKGPVETFQEFLFLCGHAFPHIFRQPPLPEV